MRRLSGILKASALLLLGGVLGYWLSDGITDLRRMFLPPSPKTEATAAWDDFAELSTVIPGLTRIYPNGQADVNHFHAAGGVSFLVRELLSAGLMHADVRTAFGTDMTAYTQEPFLEDDKLIWREGTRQSLENQCRVEAREARTTDILGHIDTAETERRRFS